MRRALLSSVIALAVVAASLTVRADDEAPTAPKVETPKVETPKVETPKVEAPKAPRAPVVAPVVAKTTAAAPQATTAAAAASQATATIAAPPPAATVQAAPTQAVVPKGAATASTATADLGLRPSPKPLTFGDDAASKSSWGTKGIFAALVIAGGIIAWKRRKTFSPRSTPSNPLRVLGRTTMGLRGEIALIEVGGMRIVVGVTPTAMQTLAVLPDEDAMKEASTDPEPELAIGLGERAKNLFMPKDLGPPIPARATSFAASRYADADNAEFEADDARRAETRRPEPKRTSVWPEAKRSESPRPSSLRPESMAPAATQRRQLEGQARGLALALGNRR